MNDYGYGDYGQGYDYGQGGYYDQQMVDPKKGRNQCWENWRGFGLTLGFGLVIFGGVMLPIEVSRIIAGSINRSSQGSYLLYPNYNIVRNVANAQVIAFEPDLLNANPEPDLENKGIIPYDALSSNGFNNFPIQDKYLWPWSHAALLFSLVTVAAGLVGCVSGMRRTYGSLFSFFTLSLLSWMLSIFLIVYYAVELYWQVNNNWDALFFSYWTRLDYRLAGVMLALSCAVFLFSMLATICTGCGFSIGSNKARLQRQPKMGRKQKQPKY